MARIAILAAVAALSLSGATYAQSVPVDQQVQALSQDFQAAQNAQTHVAQSAQALITRLMADEQKIGELQAQIDKLTADAKAKPELDAKP